MPTPIYTAAEARTRTAFLALMNALSYPGYPQTLVSSLTPDEYPDSFQLVAETLLDLETSFFTPDPEFATQLSRTSSRTESIDRAEYIFYKHLEESDLDTLANASIGTMLFPDQAATLILGCNPNFGTELRMTGPGIQGDVSIRLGGLPIGFWALRDRLRRYPLG